MIVEIRRAASAEQRAEAFALRHRVFQGEGILQADHGGGGRLFDIFDTMPESVTLAAYMDDRIVGSIRGSAWTSIGFPSDDFFDFRPHLPDEGRTACSASMLCVDDGRRGSTLGLSLVQMVYYWALAQGATHVFGPVRPEAVPLFERTGGQSVGGQFDHPTEGVPVVPMVLKLTPTADSFVALVSESGTHAFIEDFRRRLYQAGDAIVRAGDDGDEAFVLVRGTARVERNGSALETIEAGEIFGETSLLLGCSRTADVIADGAVELMVLGREAFEQQIIASPDASRRLLRAMGARLARRDSRATDTTEQETS